MAWATTPRNIGVRRRPHGPGILRVSLEGAMAMAMTAGVNMLLGAAD